MAVRQTGSSSPPFRAIRSGPHRRQPSRGLRRPPSETRSGRTENRRAAVNDLGPPHEATRAAPTGGVGPPGSPGSDHGRPPSPEPFLSGIWLSPGMGRPGDRLEPQPCARSLPTSSFEPAHHPPAPRRFACRLEVPPVLLRNAPARSPGRTIPGPRVRSRIRRR